MNDKNTAVFIGIYDATYDAVFRYAAKRCRNAEDTADVIQDTYTELCRILTEKGEEYMRDPAALVMSIAKRRVSRHYSLLERLKIIMPLEIKRNNNDEERFITDFEGMTSLSAEDESIDGVFLDEIWRAVESCGEDVSEIFRLRYMNGMPLEEIAGKTGMPLHTVRNRLYRTLASLKERFGN